MGSDDHYSEEAPTHRVRVDAFSIDATTVTNAEFASFVDATGYVTVAERELDPADFPEAPGRIRTARRARSTSAWTTPWSTCHTRTPRRTPPGSARRSPPRPSGST